MNNAQAYGFQNNEKDRLILQSLGGPKPSDNFQTTVEIVKDTLLWEGGATIEANNELFTSANKKVQYKTPGFPSNSQAFAIDAINILPYLKFPGDVLSVNTLTSFLMTSSLKLTIENNEVFDLPLNIVTNFFAVNQPGAAAADKWLTMDRRNMDYGFKLPGSIIINAGQTFNFSIITTGTFVLGADSATANFPLPGSGLADNRGYALQVQLLTRKIRLRY